MNPPTVELNLTLERNILTLLCWYCETLLSRYNSTRRNCLALPSRLLPTRGTWITNFSRYSLTLLLRSFPGDSTNVLHHVLSLTLILVTHNSTDWGKDSNIFPRINWIKKLKDLNIKCNWILSWVFCAELLSDGGTFFLCRGTENYSNMTFDK